MARDRSPPSNLTAAVNQPSYDTITHFGSQFNITCW